MNEEMQTRICRADSDIVATMQIAFFLLSERTRTRGRCIGVPMKGNNMTNQNQPGQQNQTPGQKPGQQQGGGQKPGQQSQAPGKGGRSPKEPHDQTSNSDT
jgi:hypothetical protein